MGHGAEKTAKKCFGMFLRHFWLFWHVSETFSAVLACYLDTASRSRPHPRRHVTVKAGRSHTHCLTCRGDERLRHGHLHTCRAKMRTRTYIVQTFLLYIHTDVQLVVTLFATMLFAAGVVLKSGRRAGTGLVADGVVVVLGPQGLGSLQYSPLQYRPPLISLRPWCPFMPLRLCVRTHLHSTEPATRAMASHCWDARSGCSSTLRKGVLLSVPPRSSCR